MRLRLQFVATVLILSAVLSCSTEAPQSSSDGTWVGTITTEGNVTTVVNKAGSVWGGNAKLVEEASIGVAVGPDEFMFGNIAWVYEHSGKIYVIDPQVPAVRTFDLDGNFSGNLGAAGQGPGEYMQPWRLAVAEDGRVFLSEKRAQRVNVYAADGTPLDTWQTARMTSLLSASLVVDAEGVLWIPIATSLSPDDFRQGLQALPDGEPGARAVIEHFGGEAVAPSPAEHVVWIPYGGGTVIAGRPETHGYRFEVQRLGDTVLAVERFWEPIPVNPEYAAWGLAVYGQDHPTRWPPFVAFTAAESGEIWVTRHGAAQRVPECEEGLSDIEAARIDPCWRPTFIADVFGEDGRYLGEIDVPDDLTPVPQWMHIDKEMLVARSLDAAGVLHVKRYRLVQPGEEATR